MSTARTIFRRETAAVVLFALLSLLISASAAAAQEDPYGGGKPSPKPTLIIDEAEPEVLGETHTNDVGGPDVLSEQEEPEVRGGVLPLTGGNLVLFVVIGGAAIALGTVMYRRGTSKA